jgi:hypothetical protein
MLAKLLVVDFGKLYSDPSGNTHIGRTKIDLWRGFDERLLQTRFGGNPDGDAPVVVVIVGKHCEDAFSHEKRWLAVRKFFGDVRQRSTDSPDPPQMLLALFAFALPDYVRTLLVPGLRLKPSRSSVNSRDGPIPVSLRQSALPIS